MVKAISLSRGVCAIIDDEDFELVSLHRWYASDPRRKRNGHYVMCSINGKTVYLHRFLMGAESGQVVDHVNGDSLDNRRSNLRFATIAQNGANRNTKLEASNLRGVYIRTYKSGRRVYRADVGSGDNKFRGVYRSDPVVAAKDYDREAKARYGRFARLNCPEDEA